MAYTGPGDIVSGALGWWGLRAYSAATCGTPAIRIWATPDFAGGDGTQIDISTIASGALQGTLDQAAVATFMATHAPSGVVIRTFYDQSGHSSNLVSANVSPGDSPQLLLNTVGSSANLPVAVGNAIAFVAGTLSATPANPYTLSIVYNPTIDQVNKNIATVGSVLLVAVNSPPRAYMFAGSALAANVSVGTLHALQCVFNAESSTLNVDAVAASGDIGSGTPGGPDFTLFSGAGGSAPLTGYICEAGVWQSGFTSPQQTNMKVNQTAYWTAAATYIYPPQTSVTVVAG